VAQQGPAKLPRHVLAIDDSPDIRSLYRELLGDAGYRVSCLPVGDVDLGLLAELAPDLVLIDYGSREAGPGWALLRELRTDQRTARLPIVVCTGSAAVRPGRPTALLLMALGVGIVPKPFDVDHLLDEVECRLPAVREAGGDEVTAATRAR
jgi:two-component system OmpR family response regulator